MSLSTVAMNSLELQTSTLGLVVIEFMRDLAFFSTKAKNTL